MRKSSFPHPFFCVLLSLALLSAPSCRKDQKEQEQKPLTEKDTQRGFSQNNDDVVVEMPDEVVYIKSDVNQDVTNYNPDTGTITFQNSEELERQNIKAGDILYSAERTEKTPNGYSLRVTGVSRQGDMVTYQTEPASLLEVFDHLEETATLKVGTLKPEDITVYSYTSRGGDEEQTKSLDISTEGGIENFSTSTNETSFDWVFYRRYSSSNPGKVVYQAKLGLTIQHEPFEDKSSILIDMGHMVLFSMMKMGVMVDVTFETGDEVSEEEYLIGWSNVKSDLLDKKIDAVVVPIVLGWGNAVVNPSIVLSFQFGLDVSGNFTVEAGFKDQVVAFNVENVGYFMPEFLAKSYIRSVSNGHPEFRIKSEAEVNAYVSVGPGLRLEFPALPIKEDDKWTFSHLGAYALGTLRGKANVNVELDPLSGGMSINSFGSGEAALELALQGKIGFTKLVSGDIDLRADLFSQTLGEWTWSYYMESPTPYNLNTKVDGDKATLIWDSQSTGMMSPVYDIYLDVGEGYVLYQPSWKQKSIVYNAESDGVYRWKVTARTGNGKEYPCAEEQEFTIAATTLKTLEPEIDTRLRKVVVPVSFNTRNQVISYGVAFSETEDFSGNSEEIGGTGIGYKFSAEYTIPRNTVLYARGYMTIKTSGRPADDQYKKLYGNVVKIELEEARPIFRLSDSSADFGSVEVGGSRQVTRTIYNDGESDLVISSVTCQEKAFMPSWESATIKPNSHQDITITFDPSEAKQYKADMQFICNANNADAAVISLTGTGTLDEMVDLGLSVKWATCNLGASTPFEYGDYYAWGETKTKRVYDWSTYKWCNGSTTSFTKYNSYGQYGKVDYKTSLDNADDAAYVILKDDWRMPTEAECIELRDKCTWKWTTKGGIYGSEVTGPNGNSIFLPAGGAWVNSSLDGGQYGQYWTRDLFVNDSHPEADRAVFMGCYSEGHYVSKNTRSHGFNIRPVFGQAVPSREAKIKVSKTYLEFGDIPVGQASTLDWTITNIGDAPLKVTALEVPTGFSTDFSSWSAKSLEPGGSHTFKVTFKPTQAKDYSGKMVFRSNAVNAQEQEFSLIGKGILEEMVDLGLSVKWATCNLGASTPEQSGYYFAWGETMTKSSYSWSNYAHGSLSTKLTKYCSSDGKTILDAQDDAARAILGSSWRMPTHKEIEELVSNCNWSWGITNGVYGYKVTGPNKKSIFLPAAAHSDGRDGNGSTVFGFYWASDVYTGDAKYRPYYLHFNEDSHTVNNNGNRPVGAPIRAVRD